MNRNLWTPSGGIAFSNGMLIDGAMGAQHQPRGYERLIARNLHTNQIFGNGDETSNGSWRAGPIYYSDMGRSPGFQQSYSPNITINNIVGGTDEKKTIDRETYHGVERQRNRVSTREEYYPRYYAERDPYPEYEGRYPPSAADTRRNFSRNAVPADYYYPAHHQPNQTSRYNNNATRNFPPTEVCHHHHHHLGNSHESTHTLQPCPVPRHDREYSYGHQNPPGPSYCPPKQPYVRNCDQPTRSNSNAFSPQKTKPELRNERSAVPKPVKKMSIIPVGDSPGQKKIIPVGDNTEHNKKIRQVPKAESVKVNEPSVEAAEHPPRVKDPDVGEEIQQIPEVEDATGNDEVPVSNSPDELDPPFEQEIVPLAPGEELPEIEDPPQVPEVEGVLTGTDEDPPISNSPELDPPFEEEDVQLAPDDSAVPDDNGYEDQTAPPPDDDEPVPDDDGYSPPPDDVAEDPPAEVDNDYGNNLDVNDDDLLAEASGVTTSDADSQEYFETPSPIATEGGQVKSSRIGNFFKSKKKEAVDRIKSEVKEKTDKLKEEAKEAVKRQTEKAKAAVKEKADAVKNKIKEKIQNNNDKLKKKATEAKDKAKAAAKATAKKAKDKVKNLFKRKKK
jgi:hypothetical protein